MILGSLLIIALLACTSGFRLVCYYESLAQLRTGMGKFEIEDINATLCTHIVYAYAQITGLGLKFSVASDENTNDGTIGIFERIARLKSINENLKVLLAIAGNYDDWYPWKSVMLTSRTLDTFVLNVIIFLYEHGFDGVDLNWYYPETRIRPIASKEKILIMLVKFYNAFKFDSQMRNQNQLIISASLPALKDVIDYGYDPVKMSEYLDFISITTFDMHGSWDKVVGFNAPLYPKPTETGREGYLNVDQVVMYYLSLGVAPQKLTIGVAAYGRSFTLDDPNEYTVGSKASTPGNPGSFTNISGFMAYYEICQFLKFGTHVESDSFHHSPFAYSGNQWVGYDDVESISAKVCYVKSKSLGGIMVRSLDLDDFTGSSCGQGKYPLVVAISRILQETGTNLCSDTLKSEEEPKLLICRDGATRLTFFSPAAYCNVFCSRG